MAFHSRRLHSAMIHPVTCGRLSLPSARAVSISVCPPTCISLCVTPVCASVICEIPVSHPGLVPYCSHDGQRSESLPTSARPQCLAHVRTTGEIASPELPVMERTQASQPARLGTFAYQYETGTANR